MKELVDQLKNLNLIIALQKRLKELGYDVQPDGIFGPNTGRLLGQCIMDRKLDLLVDVRPVNAAGMALIKEFEGLAKKLPSGMIAAYLDPVGIPTIGWGHTKDVSMGQVISQGQAEQFLEQDLEEVQQCLSQYVNVPLTDNQYAALCSFVFNVGVGAFISSNLRRKLNNRDYVGAADEFPKWSYSKKRQLQGLLRRRNAEMSLFKKPDQV